MSGGWVSLSRDVAICLMLVINAVFACRLASRVNFRSAVSTECCKLLSIAGGYFAKRPDIVQKKLQERHRRRFLFMVNWSCVLICFYATVLLVDTVWLQAGFPRPLTDGQKCLVLAGLTWATLLTTCPMLLSEHWMINIWYGIASVCCILWTPLSIMEVLDANVAVWNMSEAFFARLLLSVGYGKLKGVAVWSGLYMGGAVYTVVCGVEAGVLPSHIIMLDVVQSLAILIFVANVEHSMVVEISEEVEAEKVRREKSAGKTLLNIVCDVMVEVDEDLKFVGDSVAFRSLLLLSSKSLEGMQFDDYISDSDEKDRFRKHLLASQLTGEHAASMLLEMRDSMGTAISIELFNVSFQLESGSWHHLLGVREFTDAQPITSDQTTGELSDTIIAEANAERIERRARARATKSRKGTSSSSEASSGAIDSLQSNNRLRGQVRGAPGHAYPDLFPTTSLVHDASAVHAMLSWNLLVPRTMCCPFHTYTRELKKTVQRLETLRCIDNFPSHRPPDHVFQCQTCGYLDDCNETTASPWRCLVCNADQYTQTPSASSMISL
eukprot:TRINITY_DN56983_c0_g1_i1.p1 TRINITY_DN56983_c0_g1~~TRINITY_DN56983_c0_g1_i1.p1  ORF type:complete len:552 (+),score=64.82 TRINITY_DN56983_c0_g1_i1:92-1747(+)